MLCGWEGNRWSGVTLAMRHKLSGLSTDGLKGQYAGDEYPAYAPLELISLPQLRCVPVTSQDSPFSYFLSLYLRRVEYRSTDRQRLIQSAEWM